MSLSIVFMGTPVFAVATLEAVIAAGHRVTAAYTQPPRPAGRGMKMIASPVAECAGRHGMIVETPVSLRGTAEVERFRGFMPDVAVVVAYGLLLPPAILAIPRHGCLNLHASLLPRWRGAAPIQRAVMAGDAETGAMVMRMEAGLDTGPVALERRVPITAADTAGDLHDRLMKDGAGLMVEALDRITKGAISFSPQPEEGVTYAHKIDKAEARIDWSRSAGAIQRLIHGLSPYPGAWCTITSPGGEERLRILRCETCALSGAAGSVLDDQLTIACGEGSIRPLIVQRPGRKAMETQAALRGSPLPAGTVLG